MLEPLLWRQQFFLAGLYIVIGVSLLAPIASDQYLPEITDFSRHVAGIVQAKMALSEGQFPIRVAPWQNHGWGNAFFQFYSPLPYMFAGSFYILLPHANPFIFYKLTLLFSLLLAGTYCYRLASWLTHSHGIGILSSIVYITAPYLLININTRGDFTEAVSQGLIPVVLYYTLQCFLAPPKYYKLALISISWAALCTTHLLTFIYTSFFVGLLLLMIIVLNRPLWKRLLLCGLAYGYGCLLVLWYLAPIALIEPLLAINNLLGNPYGNNWLTPLATLLSVTAVSPLPLPGNNLLPMALYSALGWPILLATGITLYSLFQPNSGFQSNSDYTDTLKIIVTPLLILFGIAFLMAWSPINFWPLFPKFLASAQFSYRLLAQTMWIGTILFAISLALMFKEKLELRHIVIGLLLLSMASSPWLSTNKGGPSPAPLRTEPELGCGLNYLISPPSLPKVINTAGLKVLEISQLITGKNAVPPDAAANFCKKSKGTTICQLTIPANTSLTQLPMLYYPQLLDISVDGQKVNYLPLVKDDLVLTGLKLTPGTHQVSASLVGLRWANWISKISWIILLLPFFASMLVYLVKIIRIWLKRNKRTIPVFNGIINYSEEL